jgi:predicted dienelactone hydrolase
MLPRGARGTDRDLIRCLRRVVTVVFAAALPASASFASVGYQEATVPDRSGSPLAVGIWYPSSTEATPQPLGMLSQDVALNSPIAGSGLPLVLISHGTGGSKVSHLDTANALARAGFVVAAPTHTGDNTQDRRYAGNAQDLTDRPRQIKVLLDWLLSSWNGSGHLNPRRIGFFGFSLGAFTGLVLIGGTPDLRRMRELCSINPKAPECDFIRQAHGDQLDADLKPPVWVHDNRIKAAVLAAPAAGYLFGPGSLREVSVPIQMWRAENDTQAPDGWNGALIRDGLVTHPDSHMVRGADHFVFLTPCSDSLAAAAPLICTDVGGFDRVAFHRTFNQAVADFFTTGMRER